MTEGEGGGGTARGPKGGSAMHTIGGVLVGFDEQVFGRTPPGGEVHEQIDRAQTISSANGLTIEIPDHFEPSGGEPA